MAERVNCGMGRDLYILPPPGLLEFVNTTRIEGLAKSYCDNRGEAWVMNVARVGLHSTKKDGCNMLWERQRLRRAYGDAIGKCLVYWCTKVAVDRVDSWKDERFRVGDHVRTYLAKNAHR